MKRISLLILLLSAGLSAYSTTFVVTNSGFNFTPATITITFGDSVRFTVAGIHKPIEVSQTTWNNNDNTPLAGGFQLNNGGGLLVPSQLAVGTHFYVCEPHASGGMKGTIIVQGSTAIEDFHFPAEVSVFPNPSSGKFQVIVDQTERSNSFDLEVYTVEGKRVYVKSRTETAPVNPIDLSTVRKGIYVVKLQDGNKRYSTKVIIQ